MTNCGLNWNQTRRSRPGSDDRCCCCSDHLWTAVNWSDCLCRRQSQLLRFVAISATGYNRNANEMHRTVLERQQPWPIRIVFHKWIVWLIMSTHQFSLSNAIIRPGLGCRKQQSSRIDRSDYILLKRSGVTIWGTMTITINKCNFSLEQRFSYHRRKCK